MGSRPLFMLAQIMCGIGLIVATSWSEGPREPIGLVAAVEGNTFVAREGEHAPHLLSTLDPLRVSDVLETQSNSRSKILFQDDTLLTIGQNSRVEILEHSSDTAHQAARTILRLDRGTLRLAVGPKAESESDVQIRTPSALLSSGQGYFVVWVEEAASTPPVDPGFRFHRTRAEARSLDGGPLQPESTSVINIGTTGKMTVDSAGQMVTVHPGQFTVASPRKSLSPAATISRAFHLEPRLADTNFRGVPRGETAKQTLRGLGQDFAPRSQGGVAGQPGVVTRPKVMPPVLQTPPAVISGAAEAPSAQRAQGSPEVAPPPPPPAVRPSPAPAPPPIVRPSPPPPPSPRPSPPPPPSPRPAPAPVPPLPPPPPPIVTPPPPPPPPPPPLPRPRGRGGRGD